MRTGIVLKGTCGYAEISVLVTLGPVLLINRYCLLIYGVHCSVLSIQTTYGAAVWHIRLYNSLSSVFITVNIGRRFDVGSR